MHQWFGEVVLFGVDHLAGPAGLIALRMLVVLFGAVLLHRNVRREGAPVVAAAAIVLLPLAAARPRFFERPFLVSFVFLPMLQGWIADLRYGRTRRLWPVLALMAFWGHVHSGVIFGILYLGAVVVGEGLKILIARGRDHRAESAVAEEEERQEKGPHARRAHDRDGDERQHGRDRGEQHEAPVVPAVKHLAGEAIGARPYRAVDLSVDWPFDLVAGALLTGILLRPKRVDLTQLIVVAGFGFLAFQAVREILSFAAVAAPMIGRTWGAG